MVIQSLALDRAVCMVEAVVRPEKQTVSREGQAVVCLSLFPIPISHSKIVIEQAKPV